MKILNEQIQCNNLNIESLNKLKEQIFIYIDKIQIEFSKIKDIISDKEINVKVQIEYILKIQLDIVQLIKNENNTPEILSLFVKEYISNNFKIKQLFEAPNKEKQNPIKRNKKEETIRNLNDNINEKEKNDLKQSNIISTSHKNNYNKKNILLKENIIK